MVGSATRGTAARAAQFPALGSIESMDPFLLTLACILAVLLVARLRALHAPGMRNPGRFNSTAEWTPVSQEGQTRVPIGVPLTDWLLGVIRPRLEGGETLEGFARGFFYPPRRQDYRIKVGLDKHPLLIAVTSRRMLLFEFGRWTVVRSCFIEYDAIQYLRPPKPGPMGTSGNLRFGLHSGAEYQVGFLGPLFSDELMQHEQRLAAYLRSLGPRFASSTAPLSAAA